MTNSTRNIFIVFFITSVWLNATGQLVNTLKLESLQNLLRNAKEDTNKVKTLLEISHLVQCNDTVQSLKAAENALAISQKLNWKKGKILALKKMAGINEKCLKNYTKSIIFFMQSARLSEESGDTFDLADVYNSIGQIYEHTNKFDSALEYFQQSMKLYADARFQTCLLANSGVVYNDLGDYPHALENYEKALKLTQSLLVTKNKNQKDTLTWLGLLITTGDIYVSMSMFNNALNNYYTALKEIQNLKRDDLEMYTLTEIGKVYKLKKDYTKAIDCYEQALSISNALKEDNYKGNILNEIANLYIETNDLQKALKFATESNEIVERNKALIQLPKNYTTLGIIYSKTNHYKISIEYLEKALRISKIVSSIDGEKDAWQALDSTYFRMNQIPKAYMAYHHYINLRDSLYDIGKAKELVRIDLQSGFDKIQLADSLRQSEAKKTLSLELQRQRIMTYGGFAGLLMVLLISFFIYRNYTQQKKANKIITKAKETIQKEKQVSETLLLNILPEEVAQELKSAGKVHAKLYDEVTVLFTDFVDFTKAGERMSPRELVEELDTCFQAFDMITEKYNTEKIKTVGDAYLAVSGLPHANHNHASDVVSVAREILDFMLLRKQALRDKTFGIRIGIHSGSVVAGIVGVKKFAYDIWGDTVNTAARMEQNSEAGKINISATTYELVKDKFNCEYRGEIEAKGKGMLKMYYVG